MASYVELEGRENETERSDERETGRPDEGPPQRRPRSRKLLYLLAAGVVLVAVAAWFWLHYRNRVSTDDAQVDGHIAPIASKVSGSVAEVLVNDNQFVHAGDVLVRIDPRDYQARVDQAQAALQYALSQARGARAGVPLTTQTTASGTSGAAAQLAAAEAELQRSQVAAQQAATSEIAAARANVASKEASNQRAQADLARMRPLVQKAEISQQQFDAYVAAARVAESELTAARERLAAAEQGAQTAQAGVQVARARVEQARAGLQQSRATQGEVAVTQAQSQSASAGVQQARANLEAAQLQLSYTTITAPIDGVVTRKSVEPGQMIQPGQGLMTLIPLHDVWVTANFKETQLGDVRVGQRAEVKVDMYGDSIAGRVDSIAGATGARLSLLPPENATGNFVKVVQRIPVKIVFDKLPSNIVLRPGMNVDATIFTQ
jgi:membrane fusion protein, multidrug efflux system